jgi:LDH2 family malate/lactate/ureidoglycolate dehydrogenase
LPNYPSAATDIVVPYGQLLDRVETIFARCGMAQEDARLLAESLVIADLRGVHSHGVLRVPDYVKKLTVEGVDPKGRPRLVSERQAAVVVDGGNAMGQIACRFAMEQAIERAGPFGVAIAAVRGSNHCGALFYYAMAALERGMIGVAATNALPTMAPWGGRDKILGINPLAVAIPSGEEPPIVLDAAFSASSHGKIRVYHQKGLAIPEGWAFDTDGEPTTDSARALEGLLQPAGGYKGVGLAIVMGVLSSLLSGAAFGTELGNMVEGARAGCDGQFLMAVNVAAFQDIERFRERVDGIVRQIRGSATAPGFTRCYAPGELEHETERRYREGGIPLSAETLAGLAASERVLGLAATLQ